ncbi:MAG: thiolase family protein [Deltaproteobacteria bacterium]|nr:MAG: thiolase family protein [Deltaproteobacteria bacterium]
MNHQGGSMGRVAIVGMGTTKFRARWVEKTYFELAFEAAKMAIEDAGIEKDRIDCAVYGIYNDFFQRQYQPDAFVHDYLGLGLKPAVRVNTGGATGGSALRIGYAEVASGLYDICLVLGVEKCNDCFNYEMGITTPEVLRAILYTADMTYDNPAGRTAASGFALAVIAHREKYGNPTEEQMAKVSVKNHFNATKNPIAQSPQVLTVDEVLKSRKIVEPFKFYDNCLYTEGSSAVILASEKVARQITKKPVWITGVGASTDYVMPGNRPNIYTFESSRVAAKKAYQMAGIRNPLKDLDLAELHDAFTGTEIMAYEDCFFCEEGQGGALIDDGVVMPDGELPVNLSGGLIGCGHAVGATGVMQTYEVALHLRGEAGERQMKNARRGLVQSIGGTLCTWTVCLVLEREG